MCPTLCQVLYNFPHLTFLKTQQSKYYFHFTDEESEAYAVKKRAKSHVGTK